MQPKTIRTLKYYGLWAFAWVSLTVYGQAVLGHGEYGISAHLILVLTGSPLSLFSCSVHPNGGVLATFAAGVIGLFQWCIVAELSARYEAWRKSRGLNT